MSLLGDLRGNQWQYEKYPALFEGRRGSMIPFSLFLLHAVMPACAGEPLQAQQRLYNLLANLQRKQRGRGESVGTARGLYLSRPPAARHRARRASAAADAGASAARAGTAAKTPALTQDRRSDS